MRELIDCHVHTEFNGHATGSVAEIVAATRNAGLVGIVFAEHLPLPFDLDPEGYLAPSPEEFARYATGVHEAREAVAAEPGPGLEIVLGAEADWLSWCLDKTHSQLAIAREAGVTVLLGSVHFIGGWAFDDPNDMTEWERREVDTVWEEYFSHWCDAARSGLFDVMAHPDLPKKFGHRPSFDTRELYAEAASAAAEGGVFVEVSTAGLRKPVAELYPGPELLAAFAERRVDVTVGSDAHQPGEVGFEIAATYETLRAAGYQRVALPRGRGEARWIEL